MVIFVCSGPCNSKPRTLSGCSKVIGAWAMGASAFSYPEEAGIPIGRLLELWAQFLYYKKNVFLLLRTSVL